MWSRHRGARQVDISILCVSAANPRTGSRNLNRLVAPVRVGSKRAIRISGSHCYYVVVDLAVFSRPRIEIPIHIGRRNAGTRITGCDNVQNSSILCPSDCIGDCVASTDKVAGISVAIVCDSGAIVGCIVDGSSNISVGAGTDDFQGHQACIPSDTGHTNIVVAPGANGTSNMGAVPICVHRISIVVFEIVAPEVVDIPVTIIVNAVVGDLAGVRPDIVDKVWMIILHTRVNHADNDGGTVGPCVPCALRTDVRKTP